MKILLADDETLVRSTIRSMLEEMDMPARIVGEARNGEELLDLVEKHAPDLVFVDIRMPKLSGLEAIASGKQRSPHTQWIVLSGFPEFNYAQEAVRLGVSNYLLKPVEPDELKACVVQALDQFRQRFQALNLEFEHMTSSLLLGTHPNCDQQFLDYMDAHHFQVFVICADAYAAEVRQKWQLRYMEELRKEADQCMPSVPCHFVMATLPSGNIALVAAWSAKQASQPDLSLLEQRAEQAIKRNKEKVCRVTAFKGYACEGIQGLTGQIRELQSCTPLRALLAADRIWSLEELKSLPRFQRNKELGKRLEKLCVLFRNKDYVGYNKEVSALEKELGPLGGTELHAVNEFITVSIDEDLAVHEAPQPLPSGDQWFKRLQQLGDRMVSGKSDDHQQPDLVQQVIAFVSQNYMRDIGIGLIANQLNVTPNYLSSLFHKKQGITFVKYLTETRMLKAKELLLSTPSLKVQEVTEAVGYYSTRHFTKLFKEQFGCYPSELREQAMQK